jgi:hypothetical protein
MLKSAVQPLQWIFNFCYYIFQLQKFHLVPSYNFSLLFVCIVCIHMYVYIIYLYLLVFLYPHVSFNSMYMFFFRFLSIFTIIYLKSWFLDFLGYGFFSFLFYPVHGPYLFLSNLKNFLLKMDILKFLMWQL